ncbi:MAG: SIMPL domain-containing protein [Candidatus Jorgensenbacteria bacterium]
MNEQKINPFGEEFGRGSLDALRVKQYFWVALTIAVLVAAYAVWSYARTYSQSIEPSSFRSFSVSGEGKAVAIPDIASFTFSVVTEGGKDIGALQLGNTEKANAAVAFVKGEGVEAKDIRTQAYRLEPRYQYYACKTGACLPPEIVGYTITQSVAVKVRDFAKIGGLLSGVLENGANAVADFQFTVDDPTAVQAEARAEAVTRAKAKADEVAKAAGFSVGRLLSIDEGGGYQPMYSMAAESLGRGGGPTAAPTPTIEPGSQEVTVNVMLRYEIK